MLKNTVIYVAVLLFIFLVVLFGAHYLLPHWFPSLLGWRSSLDRDSEIAILKLISATIAFFVIAVLAGAASVFNVLYQIQANRDLEARKGVILEKIEEARASAAQRLDVQRGGILENIETKKANSAAELDRTRSESVKEIEQLRKDYVAELENHKNLLAGQLDAEKQQLGTELGAERLRIEKSHRNLDTLLKAVSEYRAAVGSLASGKFERDLANECAGKLNLAMDFISSNAALYHALETFRRKGVYIFDGASGLSSEEEYRNIWRALGVSFAADAENLRALLMAEDERVLRGH
jgi:type IV secretory pathway VirB4 component